MNGRLRGDELLPVFRQAVRVTWQRATRYLWLAALCASASGCATYQPVVIPPVTSESTSRALSASVLEGDVVRIALHSGKQVSGRVLWVSGSGLGLSRGGNYDHEELVINYEEIESVKMRTQTDGQIELGWFAAIGVAILVSAYYAMRNMGLN